MSKPEIEHLIQQAIEIINKDIKAMGLLLEGYGYTCNIVESFDSINLSVVLEDKSLEINFKANTVTDFVGYIGNKYEKHSVAFKVEWLSEDEDFIKEVLALLDSKGYYFEEVQH